MNYQRFLIAIVRRPFRAVVAKVVRTERRISVVVDEAKSPDAKDSLPRPLPFAKDSLPRPPPFVGGVWLVVLCGIATADERVNFKSQIAPIFQEHCVRCHAPDNAKVTNFVDPPGRSIWTTWRLR